MSRTAGAAASLLLLLFVVGCGAPAERTTTTSSDAPITWEELQDLQGFTVFQAVRRLRPRWLRTRAPLTSLVVHLNDSPIGGVEVLEQFEATEFSRIVFRNGPDATTRYGTGYGAGVIELRTRRR